MFANYFRTNTRAVYAVVLGIIITAAAYAGSLFIIGFDGHFIEWIAAGTVCGGTCVFLIELFLSLAADRLKAGIAFAGFLIRMVIFAGMFYISLDLGGYRGGAGFAIAFLAQYAGASLIPKLKHFKSNNHVHIYEDFARDSSGRIRHIFVKKHDTVRYRNGRRFVTHRAFRVLKEVKRHD